MSKSIKTALLAFSALVAAASASFSANAIGYNVPVTSSALNRLCYVKAEDAPVTYHAEASRYGISRHTLKKLETTIKCDGVLLGEVENNWVKRNPSN